MNRKMFSLVTSLAILSSSFSPTWAAGKNFTYNNLEKSLAIHAEAKEVKSSEAKEELPLVRETMPDDSVKDKYARIIFVPGTSTINGVKNYGKLLDKEGEKVLLSDISYKDKTGKEFVVRGKEYYALKTAKWINILEYKENNKKVLYVRKADNNESDPEKKKYHGFLGWKQDGKDVNPFDYGFPANISKCSIDNPLVFKSKFQNVPYFYSNKSSPKLDYDGYDFSLKKKDYSRVEFYPVGQESTWAGVLSLKDTQKKFSLTDIQNSKNIYLYISKKSGPYKFGDFKPEPISSDNKKFWYWSSNGDFSKSVKDDFEIGSKDLEFRAQYIGEYLKIDDNFDLVENPIPEGFYEVNFKPEDGYSSISNFQNAYRKFAVREGCGVGNITNLPKHPELIDMNNHKYTEKTAWYDGYTKIDDISTVKIDSDKVFTARIVRNFESEKFSPVVKEVEVNLNEDVSLEKLRKGITNLPEEVKVEIKTKADTSQLGKSKVVLKLIFSDTSSKEVEVPIKVIEREDGKLITPIPTIGAENIIKEKVSYNGKINLLDNIKNLPSEAKVEDISETIDTKTPGIYIGKVKVTFKGGSSRIVEIPVEVLAPLSDSYNPSTKEVEVNLNEDVSLEKLKEGITNLPDNVEVEIKTKADTSKAGPSKAILKIIFSDTSFKEVKVPVKVVEKIDGGIVKPIPTIKAEDIIKEAVPYNGVIDFSDNIKNLPDRARVEDVSDPINTKTLGSYVGKVKVTFKDGSSRIVEIPVEVLAPLAEKFPAQMPEKTPVEKLESLSASEKSEIIEKVKKANPQASSVEVSDRGEVTLVYTDGSKNIISPKDTIVLKEKESYKKDPEDKPGKAEDGKDPEDKPGKEDKRDPEENIEEAKDKKENNLDSWNEFPRYYVRDHKTPTYKVEVKTNSQVSQTKTQVNPKKFVIDINSGTYTLTEDGKTLEKSMEVKPIIENNRTMLPLRALAEILGAKVIWNDATRTASFTRDGLTALIQIDGSKIVLSNGKTIDLEAKPLNVNGRIYLPLVYVGQVFGLTSGNADDDKENDIEWKEESKTVTINIK
ncbi:Rib/alpha-like domain-containing protein [Peptoniphilus harei]|uniref:Rib/alpha-like domain-containing protein n=1 Tax=Peptoniphilus harei TaxID=54005 RepID=UPI00254E4397|nr:Rib/alpha-like domain-containing protein [Peptoniphilus harei]MDK7355373.1 Rib/alpha-like domain-containing protein [Peptoniphilus harei]MDK7371010.1 Rib/alpha-like domain-containing protein [Peptoniphilus harei]